MTFANLNLKQMTMESVSDYPVIGPNQTYDKQRRCRLADVISDYLDDDDVNPRKFYKELIAETQEMLDYHKNKVQKYEQFRELILGNRPIDPI